ncbi:MAG: LytTR family DNA-binding domain-containing protein [Flavobacteriales bacterium]|nr:LytTR family DNA-binding domain-containing protein [Flavobacteriales bacterium]
MRVAIVEDDKQQQETVVRLLKENISNLEIVGIADSVQKAIPLLSRNEFDLALLDVMIKGGTSLDALEKVIDINFQIVFTTSYDSFAIKAFELSATDYLLKPLDEVAFINALSKVKKKYSQEVSQKRLEILLSNFNGDVGIHDKIAFPDQSSLIFVDPKEIIRCESDNNYTHVHTKGKKLVLSKTLKIVEEMLAGKGFFRVHNRALINLSCIESISKSASGAVTMSDGSEVAISRRKKEEFMKLIKNF